MQKWGTQRKQKAVQEEINFKMYNKYSQSNMRKWKVSIYKTRIVKYWTKYIKTKQEAFREPKRAPGN